MAFRFILPSALLAIAGLSVIASYIAGNPVVPYSHFFNSDSLYVPFLISNLFESGGSIRDWYLSPAPFFFPEYIIFLAAYFLGANIYKQILLFTIFQTTLTFAATYFLSKQIVKNNAFLSAALIMVLLIWLSLHAGEPSVLMRPDTGEPFVLMRAGTYHYGTFLSEIVFIAFVVKYLNCETDKQKWQIMFALCLLAFLTSLSDNLFLVQALVPLSVSLMFVNLMIRETKVTNYLPVIIPFAFGILGFYGYPIIVANQTRFPIVIRLDAIGAHISNFFSILQNLLIGFPLFGFYYLLFLLFSLFCLVALFKRTFFLNLPKGLIQLIVFALFSSGATVSAVLLVNNPWEAGPRYFIPTFLLPVIIGVIISAYLLKDKFFIFSNSISIAVSIILCVNIYSLIKKNGIAENTYPDEIACIDNALAEENLSNGIAQYWDARYIQAVSKLKLTLAQYYGNLDELRWATSIKYFKSNYDFAIISKRDVPPHKIPIEKLVSINGPAKKMVTCGDRTLFIFGKGQLRVRSVKEP